MMYSEKLNGFWEEGYHYYLSIRNNQLTVRDYRRAILLETTISYDAKALDAGKPATISLQDNVLSRTYLGEMMSEIRELIYENGELTLLYHYTIMGDTLYHLHKTDHGPFDHIHILDQEYLPKLQGKWFDPSSKSGKPELVIKGNQLRWLASPPMAYHAVCYDYAPDQVYLVPENLIDKEFSGLSSIEVYPDHLSAYMMIMDAPPPRLIFVRKSDTAKDLPQQPSDSIHDL